jgi:acetyl-CoA carboxylase carboxyltransferase component
MDDARVEVTTSLVGTVVAVLTGPGAQVRAGGVVALVESMKLHHDVTSPIDGFVASVDVAEGDTVGPGAVIVRVAPGTVETVGDIERDVAPLPDATERSDLREVRARHALGLDEARPEAVAARRRRHRRTTRENIADLVDPGSFVEYGPLVIAAQRRRRSVEELIVATPADGLVGGLATVNAAVVGDHAARCVVVSYDYTVLAGTQGTQNHRKKDRLFELAEELRAPVVVFAEGGGGRPGDTDGIGVSGLDCLAFRWFAELSGTVPLIGIASGFCFAGNAALLGCCDVVIATEDAHIGMGGPAMIEGGGLGVHEPTAIGPIEVQRRNGVVDVVVADDAAAVAVARQLLSYVQGPAATWATPDQAALRHAVPPDRLRAFDVREVVRGLFDEGSVLELRREFGRAMVTAFARIEGRSVGVIANDNRHLAGAIDRDAADKAARFLQLCDSYGLPVVSLCDTPGMMVGPDAEAEALVRHCSRLFVTGANLRVPMVAVVLRKAYGLGAQAMMGGSTKAPLACLAWPTGEFGGMGLEGAVRLGYRRELEACEDDAARDQLFREMVDRLYEHGKALSVATHFEIDDVIDPADTRRWISAVLRAAPPVRSDRRSFVDTW